MYITVKYHDECSKLQKLSVGDWIDLRSAEDVELSAEEFKLISLGVSMKLPEGYEAHIVPRSSTFIKWGILQANGVGIIDNSYSGNEDIWKFPAIAFRDTHISKGDRICQFRIMKKQPDFEIQEVEFLEGPSRGGFGSTGSK